MQFSLIRWCESLARLSLKDRLDILYSSLVSLFRLNIIFGKQTGFGVFKGYFS